MDKNNIEDDQEQILIEKQSDELEKLYKDLEHYRRENLQFETYLLRKDQGEVREDYHEEKRGKSKKKGLQRTKLTSDEKFEIANVESEALKKSIEEGKVKSDTMLETLKAILEETDMSITEIRKDAFDFQREILIGGENSRTGILYNSYYYR